MTKRLLLTALLLLPLVAAAKTKNTALATHHTVKVGHGITTVGKAIGKVAVGTFDMLEASVDAVGVAIQSFADAVDVTVAAPLDDVPPPVHYLGVAVHEVYLGLDIVGQKLAE